MPKQIIEDYRLDRLKLLQYLESLFPNPKHEITVNVGSDGQYVARVPRLLTEAELDHIDKNLRHEDPNDF